MLLAVVVGLGILSSGQEARGEPQWPLPFWAEAEEGWGSRSYVCLHASPDEGEFVEAGEAVRRCGAGSSAGCVAAAGFYQRGDGVPADAERAVGLLGEACARENGEGCVQLGLAYWKGHGTGRDPQRAIALLGAACEAGDPRACVVIGEAFTIEEDVAQRRLLLESVEALGCGSAADVVRCMAFRSPRSGPEGPCWPEELPEVKDPGGVEVVGR